jgi:hypothetical protein
MYMAEYIGPDMRCFTPGEGMADSEAIVRRFVSGNGADIAV